MTDSRQHRVDTLRQAARRKSEAKTKAAEAAIRTLVKRGEPITFQSVQREAGVAQPDHAPQETAPRRKRGPSGRARAGPRGEPGTPPRTRPARREPATVNDELTSHRSQQHSDLRKHSSYELKPWIIRPRGCNR